MYRTRSPPRGRPPLAESSQRLRARRILSSSASFKTPSAPLEKAPMLNRSWALDELRVSSEFKPILGEFQALAKMVEDEFGTTGLSSVFTSFEPTISSPLFERGRFYDEYSARRSERLKRKKRETEERSLDLGVSSVAIGKRKTMSSRKSVPNNLPLPPRREGLRSAMKLNKENKKPLMESPKDVKSAIDLEKKRYPTRASRRN